MKATLKRALPTQVPRAALVTKQNSATNMVWKTMSEHDVIIKKHFGNLYIVQWMRHELIAKEKELAFEREAKPRVINATGSKGEWKA
jgi:hypothetical protein